MTITMREAKKFLKGYISGIRPMGDGDIFIRREYLDMVDGNLTEAAIFSKIMYWQPHLKIKIDGEMYLAKNNSDWDSECGVKEAAARKALKRLEEKGLIILSTGRFNDRNIVLIQVDPIGFSENITRHLLQKDMSHVTEGQVDMLQKGRSIYTENTEENTEENTSILAQAQNDEKEAVVFTQKAGDDKSDKALPRKRRSITEPPEIEGTGKELHILAQQTELFLLRLPQCWKHYQDLRDKFAKGEYSLVNESVMSAQTERSVLSWMQILSSAPRFSAPNLHDFVFWFYHESKTAYGAKKDNRLASPPTRFKNETLLEYWDQFLADLDSGFSASQFEMSGVEDIRSARKKRRATYMQTPNTGKSYQEKADELEQQYGKPVRNF